MTVTSMRYKITHSTTYTYSDTVPICHNEVHLTPREGRLQACLHHRLAIRPKPTTLDRRLDYFGNQSHHFSILEGHKKLSVTAISRVEVHAPNWPDPKVTLSWEELRHLVKSDTSPQRLEAYQYVFESPSVAISENIRQYAAPSFPPSRPVLDGVNDLTERIHRDFKYDPRATTISTPVDEVLEHRRGVCQDFAHLEIACLRSLGIPARYVSGYLRTLPPPGKPRLVGADASHAWLSVYCGDAGWVDVDPTNNCLPSTDHVTIGWGRDYGDVCPVKGVFVGGGTHRMVVSVDVLPLSGENSDEDPVAIAIS